MSVLPLIPTILTAIYASGIALIALLGMAHWVSTKAMRAIPEKATVGRDRFGAPSGPPPARPQASRPQASRPQASRPQASRPQAGRL